MNLFGQFGLREDWPTWIFALLCALALHTYVSQTEPIEAQNRVVPLVVVQSDTVAVANALPPECNLTVEGPKDFVKAYLDNQPVAQLNLENATSGIGQEMRLTVHPSPAFSQLKVTVSPAVHLVDLEPRKTLTFVPRMETLKELRDTLTMDAAPEGVPERVTVTGPESRMIEVAEVVYPVDLSKFEGVTQQEVLFYAFDALGTRVPFVHVDPDKLSVRFQVSRKEESIQVPVLPTLKGGPAPGWLVREIAVEPVTIELAGPGRVLSRVKRLETAPIDIEGIASDQTYTVQVIAPKNADVSLSPKTVTVRLVLEKVSGRRTFSGVPIALNDQAQGNLYRLAPAEFEITLQGDVTTLNGMLEGSIRGNLRVASFPIGEHDIRADAVELTLPPGVNVVSRAPDTFRLSVSAAAAP